MKRFAVCCIATLLAAPAMAERVSPNDIGATPNVGGTTTWSDFGTTLRDAGDCDCIDLVFIVDDTGSMGGAIANVAAGIGDILTLAGSTCGSVQSGLVTFKDDVQVDVPLTADLGLVSVGIAALAASGGAGEPEASDEALREVVDATACALTGDFDPGAFRDGCCRVAILVTDARPAGCDDTYTPGVDDVAAHARALEAAALGIQIGALFVPTFGDPGDIVSIMTDYAATTGGVYGETDPSGAGTADAIEQVILSCVGAGATELCCIEDTDCVEVLEGQCADLGGVIVPTCVGCGATPVVESTWSSIKSTF
jgi:Mg-chelatase subunit ChlD